MAARRSKTPWAALWRKTHGTVGAGLSDSTLDGIVAAIVVEQEQIGPRRYVAKLGVLFDRRGLQLQAAPAGAVWLRQHQGNGVPGGVNRRQRHAGEFRSAGKNDAQGHGEGSSRGVISRRVAP